MRTHDVIIIGGGAAGMMCGIESAKTGRSTLVIEHNKQIGNKILISGGGRCNFTNINAGPNNYISSNPHYHKSAMSRYTQQEFIDLVEEHKIEYYEKTLGQLFCKKSSREIINMLLEEAEKYGTEIRTKCSVHKIDKLNDNDYYVKTSQGEFRSESLVIATGGLSFPNRGATDFTYKVAKQFNLKVTSPRPGLVPLVLDKKSNLDFSSLSGISFFAEVSTDEISFKEAVLFTHKGLSGPAILQISNYLNGNKKFKIKIEPDKKISEELIKQKSKGISVKNFFSQFVAERFAKEICDFYKLDKALKQLNEQEIEKLIDLFDSWELEAIGDEGYKKAEITFGGVHPDELSSKTMETKKHKGLYIIGEAVDVNGWLGGYNFAWAWSSGWAAGQYT